MLSKLFVSIIFPSFGSMTRHPLSSVGSRAVRSPRFTGTVGCSDSPTAFFDRFGCPSRAVPLLGGVDRVSQVPGEPSLVSALLYDPGRVGAYLGYRGAGIAVPRLSPSAGASFLTKVASRRLVASRCCHRAVTRRTPCDILISGLNPRPQRSLSTLRSLPSRLPSRADQQDSLPAGGQPLPGGIRTRWAPPKGFR